MGKTCLSDTPRMWPPFMSTEDIQNDTYHGRLTRTQRYESEHIPADIHA